MKALKKVWEFIKKPRIGSAAVTAAALVAAVVGVAVFLRDEVLQTRYGAIAYVLYGASAIFLGYFIYCLVYLIPKAKMDLKEWANKREFTRKLVGQYGFRTMVFAAISFVISVGNAIINGTLGIIWSSVWYVALGLYYLLLSVMRGSVLLYHRNKRKRTDETEHLSKFREIRTYMTCGGWLIILPVVLSATIWEIVGSNKAFVHSGYMIFVSALYTFYKIISSVCNLSKARKTDKMSVRAVRNVNLADALVSVLALQTAMFHEFSPEANLGYANAIMGAIVCALTAVLGVTMLVIGGKQIKALKANVDEKADAPSENGEIDETAANFGENEEINGETENERE